MIWLLACGQSADTATKADAVTYELEDTLYTTLQTTWRPLAPDAATEAAIDADELTAVELDRFEENGLGVVRSEGVTWVERDELTGSYTPADDDRRSLVYLWQAADPQIIDEESPIRFESFTNLYRPSGHLTAQVFEAHVRTAQALSDASGRPFDFAVLAGDLTDGSQQNELDWFLTALNGGVIDPDSGVDDDPVPGPGNDFNDPFVAQGLDVPWYAALGNHDGLYIGGFGNVDEDLRVAAVSDEVYDSDIFPNGYRDGADPLAGVRDDGPLPADEARLPLTVAELLLELHTAGGSPYGHGLSADDVAAERAWFSVHPVPDRPIRLVVLQTIDGDAAIGLAAQGWMTTEQLEWLADELAEAEAAGELVIVMSHHRAEDFATSGDVGEEDLVAVLAASENMVLHITGHGHFNGLDLYPTDVESTDEHGYWQIMCASTVDFPFQTRVIEIVDERDGVLSIYMTNVGHNSPEDSLAHKARAQAAAALAFDNFHAPSDIDEYWESQLERQNLILRVPIPEALQTSLASYDWATRIESVETLNAL